MENILSKENKEILDLCKSKQESLNIKDLTRDMFKDNKRILDKYFRNEEGKNCFYANLLYFSNIEGIDLKGIKTILLTDFKRPISLAGYKYKKEHYMFSTYEMQSEFEEDLFKDKSRDEEEAEKREEYKYKQIDKLDSESLETLVKILYKAIRQRQVMILNLEDIPSLINNAIECEYIGVSCRPSNNAMRAKIEEFTRLVTHPEVKEWLKTKPTDMSLDEIDYVQTYQRVLRQLTDIKDNLEYVKDIVHNEEDFMYEDEILNNEHIEIEYFCENSNEEEDDD